MTVYRLVDLMVCFPFLAGRRFWLPGWIVFLGIVFVPI